MMATRHPGHHPLARCRQHGDLLPCPKCALPVAPVSWGQTVAGIIFTLLFVAAILGIGRHWHG